MNVFDFEVAKADGTKTALDSYRGQVLLIVNTASKCGFTPQYEGLTTLHETYREKGFSVLAFPCNQFGGQEPGTNEDIQSFCQLNYKTSFPVFGKVEVNGTNADPLFDYLKTEAPGILGSQQIKWNFTKFLIDADGKPVKRFAPKDSPKSIEKHISNLLS